MAKWMYSWLFGFHLTAFTLKLTMEYKSKIHILLLSDKSQHIVFVADNNL